MSQREPAQGGDNREVVLRLRHQRLPVVLRRPLRRLLLLLRQRRPQDASASEQLELRVQQVSHNSVSHVNTRYYKHNFVSNNYRKQ